MWHYVVAVATAITMVMVASLIPARRAARLEPGGHHPGDRAMSADDDGIDAALRRLAPLPRPGRGPGACAQRGQLRSPPGPGLCHRRAVGLREVDTLLYLLGLLDLPDEGGDLDQRPADVPTRSMPRRTAARGEHIGFVFQFHFLMLDFTALENVMMPMRKLGRLGPAADGGPRRGPARCRRPGRQDPPPRHPALRGVSSRERWRWPGPWPTSRPSSWPTSRPETSMCAIPASGLRPAHAPGQGKRPGGCARDPQSRYRPPVAIFGGQCKTAFSFESFPYNPMGSFLI